MLHPIPIVPILSWIPTNPCRSWSWPTSTTNGSPPVLNFWQCQVCAAVLWSSQHPSPPSRPVSSCLLPTSIQFPKWKTPVQETGDVDLQRSSLTRRKSSGYLPPEPRALSTSTGAWGQLKNKKWVNASPLPATHRDSNSNQPKTLW